MHFFEITHTYTQYMFLICFSFAFYTSPIIFFSFFFILSNTGTESEVSFSLLNGSRNHDNRHSGLDNSTTTTSTRILMSPGTKPVKIAAISGKPRVQRYLSRECEWFFNKPPTTHAHTKKLIYLFSFCSIFKLYEIFLSHNNLHIIIIFFLYFSHLIMTDLNLNGHFDLSFFHLQLSRPQSQMEAQPRQAPTSDLSTTSTRLLWWPPWSWTCLWPLQMTCLRWQATILP